MHCVEASNVACAYLTKEAFNEAARISIVEIGVRKPCAILPVKTVTARRSSISFLIFSSAA